MVLLANSPELIKKRMSIIIYCTQAAVFTAIYEFS